MALPSLKRSDDWKFTITILDPVTQLPVDITAASIWLTMKSQLADTDVNAVFQATIASIPASDANGTDAVNGVVVLVAAYDTAGAAPPANTLVAAGSYFYDVQYIATSGEISTVEDGKVTITEQVTEATS